MDTHPRGRDAEARSDEALMLAYRAGDVAAFEHLFARHRRRLFTYLLHFCGSRTQAEDLFQEVFLRVVRGRDGYRPEGSFRSWLFTIARNATTDERRRAALRETERTEAPMRDRPEHEADPRGRFLASGSTSDPQALSQAHELKERSQVALLRLPREQREVFLLRLRAGLDFRRIAESTGVDLSTAKSRMRYALAGLRRLLASELAPTPEGSHE